MLHHLPCQKSDSDSLPAYSPPKSYLPQGFDF